MVVEPKSQELSAGILYEKAHVQPTNDLKSLLWYSKGGTIEWVVGYTAWIGKTVQMHVARMGEYKYTPKPLIYAAFDYPFNKYGVDIIFGVVNSMNTNALEFDQKLGFKEKIRWNGMHDDGGDLILLEMHKKDCKWIKHETI
jgi:hypothetical protein|tara:strand:- start:601 stop:1026 length:426 start_codon:yes stop_codon:yes gene_type:complete